MLVDILLLRSYGRLDAGFQFLPACQRRIGIDDTAPALQF